MTRSRNPIGFTPWPVTLTITAIYAFLFALVIRVDRIIPPAPKSPTSTPWQGINLTESWQDLQALTRRHHPYDSRAGDQVRAWLLTRIHAILDGNKIPHEVSEPNPSFTRMNSEGQTDHSRSAVVFDDKHNDVLFQSYFNPSPVYFESNNIVVYIRGTRDQPGDWWTNTTHMYNGPGGVLVNAHFDSVSTGFGATDTGMGVVSVLQTIAHFTTPGNQPEKGILALLNNAEELGLMGAEAFIRTPLASFAHTFVNLEGTGSGGRALLLRATDSQVASHYKQTSRPYGSIFAQNAFESGVTNSATDYSILVDKKGMRGLDLVFIEGRANYHSQDDDIRHTNRESLWHMLDAALSTIDSLCRSDSTEFDGSGHGGRKRVDAGSGDAGVWFDVLGRFFALIKLHDLFALSVTLLVVGPIAFLILHFTLARLDKFYPMSGNVAVPGPAEDRAHQVKLYGLRGFFRFPLAFIIATGVTVLLALLVTKVNPYIIYSSYWAVWSMFLTAWFCTAWFIVRLGDAIHPSALARYFSLVWMYAITWIVLVVNTVLMDQKDIAGGYCLVIYHATIFAALLIAYLEFFALPRKTDFADKELDQPEAESGRESLEEDETPRQSEEVDEQTSLLGSRPNFKKKHRDRRRSSNGSLTDDEGHHNEAAEAGIIHHEAYQGEQAWSAPLPGWTWVLQFAVLGPINIVLVGQLALIITIGIYQTAEDGNRPLPRYLAIAGLGLLLLLPMSPFMHRIKWQLPSLLLLLFGGTAIYCLLAFPFSEHAKLKMRFRQVVDLDTGVNLVSLSGNTGYVQRVAYSMPSAQLGEVVDCQQSTTLHGLTQCSWDGLQPRVVPQNYSLGDWIDIDASRSRNGSNSTIELRIQGISSRSCWLWFDSPPRRMVVNDKHEYVVDEDDWRYEDVRNASLSIRLLARSWDNNVFKVSASGFEVGRSDDEISGRVECAWDDINDHQLPAYDEVLAYAPVWSLATVTGSTRALLTAVKRFRL